MIKHHTTKYKDKSSVQIGYARVSSTDNRQDLGLAVQKEALKNCDFLLVEKESGRRDDRAKLHQALELAKVFKQQGKSVTIVVYRLDRLTRKMFTLVEILKDLDKHGIQLISLQEKIQTDSLTGKLLIVLLGYVAEMEMEAIRSRTRDGLRKARERGVRLGNPGISRDTEKQIIALYKASELPIKSISQQSGVSVATIYNVLKRNKIPLKTKNEYNHLIFSDKRDKIKS